MMSVLNNAHSVYWRGNLGPLSSLAKKLLLVGHLVAVLNVSIKAHSLNCLLGTRFHSIVSELALGVVF